MSDKEFAKDYPRDDNGWIQFPRDVQRRRQLFPEGVFQHPAKANIFLTQELVRYLTEPGDTILDPFGGTGTLMLATLEGRNAVLIDIEPQYIKLIHMAMDKWCNEDVQPEQGHDLGSVFVYEGDCRQKLLDLKHLCDAAIFSPPYSTALSHSTAIVEQKEVLAQYGLSKSSPQNLARLNPFYFAQTMKTVYERMNARLVPGAPVAVISKDIMKGPQRTFISEGIIRQAGRAGFELFQWEKWKPPGSMQQSIMRSKGANIVEDEDIIIFRKEG